MGKNIVATGRSVKDAVTVALDLLNAHKDEVDIEILENENRGLLGFRVKPAVVRVTVKEKEADSEALPSFEELEKVVASLDIPGDTPVGPLFKTGETTIALNNDLSGKVWVSDGHIFCKDAPDKYPLITPVKGAKLFKNETLVEKTVIVREDDILEVKFEDEEIEPRWELALSDNHMEAILKITPGIRIHKRLKDQAPSNFIQVEIEEKRIPILLETGPIMNKLKELGIVHGVDYVQIASACVSEVAGSYVIAKGTPFTMGKNGYFNPIQQVEIVKGLKERSDGTIDYREIQEFPSVDRGQIIGVVIPPEPGYPGISVTDDPVFPPEVVPLALKAGKGVELVEEGTKVIATDAGHPEVKIKGQSAIVSVIPKLLIGKDITLETGNVRYIGDVEILGSVQDGMVVEAQGNLTVRQNVNMARISAGSSIIVLNNIIASEVTAGNSTLLKAEICQLLGEVIDQMKKMMVAINQLSSVSAFKVSSFTRTGLGPLIKILCEGKFKAFLPLVRKFTKKIQSNTHLLEKDWVEFSERLHTEFISFHSSELRSGEDIWKLITPAEELFSSAYETTVENRFIRVGFVHNSQLYSSGDIMVTGQGIYNSKLHAGGFVEVKGFVRGGEIYASKGAHIGEAGTKGGIVTKIIAPHSETIKIGSVMEDTLIQIGTKSFKFTKQTFNVHARLNEEGNLILS